MEGGHRLRLRLGEDQRAEGVRCGHEQEDVAPGQVREERQAARDAPRDVDVDGVEVKAMRLGFNRRLRGLVLIDRRCRPRLWAGAAPDALFPVVPKAKECQRPDYT
jgi:hypothetical protein